MLPIVAYGHPTLKKKATEIGPEYPGLKELIDKMFETMYESRGVGLAAPQVNKSIRLFIVDARPYGDDDQLAKDFVKVFINPYITSETGEKWSFNEGCLSVPGINEDVERCPDVVVEYMDTDFQPHKETYSGIIARIIQHEYDHLEGALFVDRLSPLKKALIKGKLNKISKGEVTVNYRMIFPNKK
jgi:peptide deformylase